MVAVPARTPVTTPVAGLTVAIDVDSDVQVLPDTPSVSVRELPVQTVPEPEILPGTALTVTFQNADPQTLE